MSTLLGTDPTTVTGGQALVVLTRAAARIAAPLAAVLVVGAFVVRGVAGGVTALVAAVVLLGLHVASGRVTARLAADNPTVMPAVTMIALLVRLSVYGAAIAVFRDVAGVDVPVLATTVISLTIAILVTETMVVARYSRFWWASTETASDDAAGDADLQAATAAVGKD